MSGLPPAAAMQRPQLPPPRGSLAVPAPTLADLAAVRRSGQSSGPAPTGQRQQPVILVAEELSGPSAVHTEYERIGERGPRVVRRLAPAHVGQRISGHHHA